MGGEKKTSSLSLSHSLSHSPPSLSLSLSLSRGRSLSLARFIFSLSPCLRCTYSYNFSYRASFNRFSRKKTLSQRTDRVLVPTLETSGQSVLNLVRQTFHRERESFFSNNTPSLFVGQIFICGDR
jgi:hypothetical protein